MHGAFGARDRPGCADQEIWVSIAVEVHFSLDGQTEGCVWGWGGTVAGLPVGEGEIGRQVTIGEGPGEK